MKNKFKPTDFALQIDKELKKSGFENYTVTIKKLKDLPNHYHFVINNHGFDMITICHQSEQGFDIGIDLVDSGGWLGEFGMFSVELAELLLFANKLINSVE